jgi:histidine phosphotransfer protein HptB
MASFDMPDMDQEVLAELQDIMGSDFGKLVKSWQDDTRQRVAAMEAAIEAEDGVQLRQVAHSLKGSSSNLGARCVVDLCIEMEKLANLKDMEAAKNTLPGLREAVQSAEQELLRLAS